MLKLLYEFLPVALFFAVFQITGNIFHATAVLIIASVLQLAFDWFKNGKVEKSRKISVAMIVVLGGLTVLLQDDLFIKWKVTVLNWLFAAVLIGSHFIGEKNIMERVMGSAMKLPAPVWTQLNFYWAGFFFISGLLNIYFAFFYGLDLSEQERTAVWVDFKFYGLLGLTLVFMVAQVFFLQKHIQLEEEEQ